ncbi:MAG: ANTAR domain-containing protein [Lachnospiraceae bacterium]|nr:ANTAR domain-containing protein [Lachnospiraceae bacterium]
MSSIIVVFPKAEDGRSIRNLLTRHGYEVTAVCTMGSQVLNYVDMMRDGIVVSGYKFRDMYYSDLKSSLPPDFDMLLLGSARVCEECENSDIVCVTMPLRVQDLMSTLEMMCMNQMRRRRQRRSRPRQRSEEEKKILWEAKSVLMERNHMTEEEAHRYIQKCSMDSGTSLTETAQMVLAMNKY